ncbi:MAG: UDP-N-acetylmuramate--L-alanine ligase, partial [Actinomycetota bacterium]|nr:UDP-N-acetylmuramate--L-alanine ligase [Actinomycetota bacterium]
MAEIDFDLARPRRIHVVGVGGAGMSAIAEVLAAMGHRVSGSDLHDSAVLRRLQGRGVTTSVGHHRSHVDGAEAVAVSTAIAADNEEVKAARAAGIPLLRRADALAAICARRRTIAVAGTHGKTTTSAMLATILLDAGRDPSFVVGGEVLGLGTGARWGRGEWMVVEADESDGTFLQLPAEVAVVTSIEPDHLEHWGGFGPLAAAFESFMARVPGGRIVCGDDPEAAGVGRRHGAVTYGFLEGVDERIVDFRADRHRSRFEVEHDGCRRGAVTLAMPGRHNAANAVAATTAALAAGVPFEEAAAALARFEGVARRFHLRGERAGVTYVDEYAHLPGEVRASLAAARDGGWR